jgi:release factor glutamine methyltransferase
MSLAQKLSDALARLVAAGIAPHEAAIDVDLYARTLLGWDRARLVTEQHLSVPPELEPRFSEWIERRTRREPSAYIVGVREFWGHDFRVSPDVLIPRPETEFIVEEALPLLRVGEKPRIADIGTGSGILAVTLAREVVQASVVATDISAGALAIAGQNAMSHGVDRRILFVQTSYLEGVSGPFDVIVSNPPYVRDRDKAALSRDVRHEPDVALFGGEDGLRHVAGVLDTAVEKLKSGGWFLMEFGYGQEDDVRALIVQRPGLRLDRIREDLQGIPRTAIMQRQSTPARTNRAPRAPK